MVADIGRCLNRDDVSNLVAVLRSLSEAQAKMIGVSYGGGRTNLRLKFDIGCVVTEMIRRASKGSKPYWVWYRSINRGCYGSGAVGLERVLELAWCLYSMGLERSMVEVDGMDAELFWYIENYSYIFLGGAPFVVGFERTIKPDWNERRWYKEPVYFVPRLAMIFYNKKVRGFIENSALRRNLLSGDRTQRIHLGVRSSEYSHSDYLRVEQGSFDLYAFNSKYHVLYEDGVQQINGALSRNDMLRFNDLDKVEMTA